MRTLYLTTLFTFSLIAPIFAASDIMLPSGVTVAPGQQASFPITLTNPAPAGGAFLSLSSSNPSVVTVTPTSVYVAGGKQNVAPVQVNGISAGTATITVSAYNLTGDSQTVQVSSQTATLSFSPPTISFAAAGSTQKVQLALSTAAPAGGVFVNLTSDNPNIAQVQHSVGFFPDGSTQAINIVPITAVGTGTTVIHASAPSIPDTTLTVTVGGSGPPPPGTITLQSGISLIPGQSAIFPVTLSTPAPAGGVAVSLSSNSPSVTVSPASVSIAAGSVTPVTQAQVTGASAGTATITASAPGYTQASQQVQVGASLSFSPPSVTLAALGSSNLQLNLNSPAPAGGLSVALSSSNTGAVTVPSSVNFAAGASSVNVQVTAVGPGSATISASAPNVSSASANITVTSNSGRDILLPTGLSLAPGDQLKFTLMLSRPAPSGGVFVILSSSDNSKVMIAPVGVFIAEGLTTASTQPRLTGVDFGSATITASASGLTGDSQVVLVGTAHGLVPATLTINGIGASQNLTVTLSSPAPAGGITFNLSSSNTSVATVPASVTIFANSSSATVPVTSVAPGVAVIHSSSLPGYGDVTATVTVVSTGTIGLPVGTTVSLGQSVAFPVTLGTPAPAGGVTVALSSTDSSKVSISPTSVTIAAGATTPVTQPQVNGVGIGSATINASATGYTAASQSVQVSAALAFTPPSLTITGAAGVFVTLSIPAPINLTANLSSSNPGVATVPATATFANGQTSVNVLVTSLAGGSTTITASGPNFASGTLAVSVTGLGANGTISLPSNVKLGTNQPVPFPVTLSIPAPAGGVTVALSSSSQSVTITPSVFVAAGSVSPATQPQIMGTAFGNATITASAPGYTTTSQQVQVGAALSFSPTSLAVTSTGTNNLQLNLSSAAPAGGLTVNLSSSNVASFTVPSTVTIAANTTSVNVPITSVATGSATITASSSAPNVTSATASASFSGADIILPSGISLLPGDQLKITLNLAKPAASGGVFITLASSDTNKLTVLPTTIFIPEGATTSNRQPQLTGLNFGTVTLTASASGLNGDSKTVTIGASSGFAPPSLTFSGTGSTQTLLLSLAAPAPAGGVTVVLSSSNPAVATVPASVTIAAGASSANVPVTSIATGATVIHASAPPTLSDTTATVTVLTAGSIGLPAISSVSLGEQIPFPVTIGTPAPAGGVTITFASSLSTSVAISPSTVFIPSGANSPAVQPTLAAYNTGSATITATAQGYATATRNILSTATVMWTPTSLTTPNTGPVRVVLALSASAPPGTTAAGRCEAPDPTTCSVTVALSSDNPNVAQIQGSISYFPDGSSQAINQITINAVGVGTTLIHAGNPPYIPDTVLSFTVGQAAPTAPTANAGQNQSVAIGATVQLSGTGSDPQNLPLTMQWSLTKPASSTAALSSTISQTPTFVADKYGIYTASLVVNNGTQSSPPSSVTITTQRPKPVANPGTGQTVTAGSTVTLNGNSSSSIDNAPLTFAWTLTRPNGSTASLTGATTATPSFVADLAGTYTAQLIVNDGFSASNPASVSIIATASGPGAGSIMATSGTPQTAGISQPLCSPFVATVKDGNSIPVPNVSVTFTAPANGASGTFAGGAITAAAMTDAQGQATSPVFTANGAAGTYAVTASTAGIATPASFSLTNVLLVQSNVTTVSGTSQSANIGAVFAFPLVVSVASSNCAVPQSGLTVSFSAPSNGASGTFAGGDTTVSAVTDSNGIATSPLFRANSVTGVYNISASTTGAITPAWFAMTNSLPAAPGSITVSNLSVGQNLQAIALVTLATPAPQGGLLLSISSSDASKLLVSSRQPDIGMGSINVPVSSGGTTVAVYVQALAASGSVTLTVDASGTGTGSGTITLTPSGFVLSGKDGVGISTLSTAVGSTETLTLSSYRLDSALNPIESQQLRAGTSVSVPVTSSSPNLGSIAQSPVVLSGGGDPSGTVKLTALAAGSLTVGTGTPVLTGPNDVVLASTFSTPAASSLSVNITSLVMLAPNFIIGKDLQDKAMITLNGASPSGGLLLTLTSNDPSKLLLSTTPTDDGFTTINLIIPAGFTHSQDFYAQALGGSGNVGYTVSTQNLPNATGIVTLTPSGIVIAGANSLLMTSFQAIALGAASQITVNSAQLTPGSNVFGKFQTIRGTQSATVNVASSNTTVGIIITSPLTINGGSGTASTTFQPYSPGSTDISVDVPAGFTTPNQYAKITANVVQPGTSLTPKQITIGNHLESSVTVQLGQTAATDTTVLITTSDPKIFLSNTATGAGSTSIPVVIKQGTNNTIFFVQGLASAGTATYTASSPGFLPTDGTVTLAPSGVVISGPYGDGFQFPTPAKITDGPAQLSISTAVLDGTGKLVLRQPLAGGASLSVPLGNSVPAKGSVPAQVIIPAGTDTVTAQFSPLTVGQTVISVPTPDGYSTPSSTYRTVTMSVQ